MSPELRRVIAAYETPFLLEQFFVKREEYGEEALGIMEEEIARRGIGDDQKAAYRNPERDTEEKKQSTYGPDDFSAFDYTFSQTDILLATTVLRDAGIPFYLDNPASSSAIPTETEAFRFFTIHVHKDRLEEACTLIAEHFSLTDGAYRAQFTDTKERLRAFNFHEVRFTESQLEQPVDVSFSSEESRHIISYARRLQDEADTIERDQERVLFYYDAIDELVRRISPDGGERLRVMDLLTIIEILQVYCIAPDFPPALDQAIVPLLDFFHH